MNIYKIYKITFVSSKGWFDDTGFHPHTEDSLYTIIFLCKDNLKAYLRVWAQMANKSTEMCTNEIRKDGIDDERCLYLSGYRACVEDIYERFEHLQKILGMAEKAAHYI